MARWARLSGAAAVVAGAVCGPGQAEDRAPGQRPHYEIAATGQTGGPGAAARVELDAAVPVAPETRRGDALLLQPGLLLSLGPDERTLLGGSLGAVWRFEGAGGIVGLNAFYDGNWIFEPGRDRAHHQAGIGADYQAGRSRVGVNWYIPLSDRRDWLSGQAGLGEYAVGGPELRYRFALDDGWALKGRALRELDRSGQRTDGAGAAHGWLVSAGLGYRIGCTRVGFDVERDTGRGETSARLSLGLRFGAPGARDGCADAAKPDFYALVAREKIVATRTIVTRRTVTLTRLPDDVTRLYEIVPGGAADSDTVWLYSQGGPVTMLEDGTGHDFYTLPEFPGHADRILVNVHQVQTLNPDLFEDPRLDSVERVRAEADVSVEILDRVIRHFKARGKRVVVFSHSFGSFVQARYLALRGPGAADRYVIMAGRLDMEEKVVRNRLDKLSESGTMIYAYEDDGATLVGVDAFDDPTLTPENRMLSPAFRMGAVFQGAMAGYRYTELLAETDLSKVIYAFGTMDRQIGRLTADEVGFLESRGARVMEIEGGHDSMLGVAREIVDAVETPVTSGAPGPLVSMPRQPAHPG